MKVWVAYDVEPEFIVDELRDLPPSLRVLFLVLAVVLVGVFIIAMLT